jgi:hypothetical protein
MDAKTGSDKTALLKGRSSSYALRLPASIKAEAEKIAKEDGTSLNQFVATAVAEKISALRTASYFEPFRARADFKAFDRIMGRKGGEPPPAGDEWPGEPSDA